MPISIASLSAALKRAGIEVKLFDNTFYAPMEDFSSGDDARVATMQVPDFDYSEVGIAPITRNPLEDLRALTLDFQPDLIGLSTSESTFRFGIDCLETLKDLKIPNIVGGVFTIFSPEYVLDHDIVNMVCIGEGEDCMVELCQKIQAEEDYSDIRNIWIKKDDKTIIKNEKSIISDLESLPILDFSVFDSKRVYKPMDGKIYRMAPIEFSRGCMFTCTYCSAPAFEQKFREAGRWLRFKSLDHIFSEIDYYIENHNIEYFYFISETFLAMPRPRFNEFVERYSKIKKPFWLNTRPETINEDIIRKLEQINCNRISMGIECGNEEYRKTMLRRKVTNKKIVEAADILTRSKIKYSVNNMIGFPDETRSIFFDTINLNREVNAASHGCYLFQPYRGTWLHQYAVDKGYWPAGKLAADFFLNPSLTMPTMSKEEILGLRKTFPLYIKLPKSEWSQIERAEKNDAEGRKIFEQLKKRYQKECLV
ncbi:MAG: B12-binding domain-containing radical SAM protein [Candidatus Heimdallarchaeota archaeon]|nr:B12-binding domain-containing radical SAM protein [Candidatus Heimdallarchaeota archaeon]